MRSITITQGEHGWEYVFDGMFSPVLLTQATKGVPRGWRQYVAKLKGEELAKQPPRSPKVKPAGIPRERPGENLGVKAQVSMPMYGMNFSPHAPLAEPDAASMQPHPVPTQIKEIDNEPVQQREHEGPSEGERSSVNGSNRSTKTDTGESDSSGREVDGSGEAVAEDVLTRVSGESTRAWNEATRTYEVNSSS